MKRIVLTLTAVLIFGWQGLSFANSSVDALIQKLKDKGILTDQDAVQLKGEISSDEKNSQETTVKGMLPDWLNSMKLTGDFRLRDQIERRKVANGNASSHLVRNRGRFRARLNVEDQVNDKLKVIFGIATDGENGVSPGNARSNNITFGGNNGAEGSFNKPNVVINKAYAVYTPASWATIMGGKMDNPIWEPGSLLWDPDITPEGGAVQLQKRINDYITPFVTTSFFVLKDAAPSTAGTGFKTDPYMYVTQGGLKGNLTDKVYYKAAASYYGVSNPNHVVLDNRPSVNTNGTNNTNSVTSTAATNYSYSYFLVGGSAEVGINDPFGEMLPSPIYIPQVGVFGQFFQNVDPSHQNSAWQMGAYMGSSALNGWGTWKIQSYYKVLERNSWLDVFTDDDFYSGATDTAGWRSELDIGLAKNTWLSLSWFRTNVFKNIPHLLNGAGNDAAFSKSSPENLIQMDLNFKF
jgi:Putative porin